MELTEYYYYIDGVKEGEAFIKDSVHRTKNECIFDRGYRAINGIYIRDKKGGDGIRFYNFYDYYQDTIWAGDLYFKIDYPSTYYYTETYDTIFDQKEYTVDILTFKNKNEKQVGVKLYNIWKGDTIAFVDTVLNGNNKVIRIPMKNYKLGINKITGGIAYFDTLSVKGTRKIHQMLFYKWLVVKPKEE